MLMLSVVLLGALMPSVIMSSVVLLSVVAPFGTPTQKFKTNNSAREQGANLIKLFCQ